MPWPKGKPRPDEDKEKIARAKKGVPHEPEHRKHLTEGQRRRRDREKKEKKS